MSPRYLLVAADRPEGASGLLERLGRRTDFRLAFSHPRLALFVNAAGRCLAAGGEGCVVGTLFRRHGRAEPLASLDEDEAASIVRSRGDALLRSFWGGYVAAVAGPDSVRILREPSATFPCYFARGPGWTAFASDAELLVESGLADVELDWRALARHFFSAGVPMAATALRGISELLPGFAVTVPGDTAAQQPCWSPWDHARARAGAAGPGADQLARTVRHCVRAWAAGRGRLLLSVSGGLDSSIVAAVLAEAGADVTGLTLYGEDAAGDERVFARALCEHLGLPLIERPYRLGDIDIAEPLGAHLPRTKDRSQALAYERAHLEVAREIGAEAFVTGNGGDSVFGYSQSAAAIADRFLVEGLGRGVLGTLVDTCRQTGCSLLDAARGAWRIARGPRGYRCRADALFLHPDMLADLAGLTLSHPWLDAPADALPGKAAHIASILRVQQSFEPSRGRYLPVLNPLMSQPVMETCLAVPSWEWRAGGRDRSLARRAFAGVLPEVVLRRRVKGGPSGFAAEILDGLRGAIGERLLEGHLARHGIVDRKALEEALDEEHSCTAEERVRILELVAAEAWLDSWLSRAGTLGRGAWQDLMAPPASRFAP